MAKEGNQQDRGGRTLIERECPKAKASEVDALSATIERRCYVSVTRRDLRGRQTRAMLATARRRSRFLRQLGSVEATQNGRDWHIASILKKDMQTKSMHKEGGDDFASLVAEANFIRATRDTGYKNTAAAIAELIDNALQAGATRVRLFAIETPTARGREITVAVMDNGEGMDPRALRRAIQFGGSTRFDDRTGLGRYGMGLPNSSISQARRLEVISWRRPGARYGCHLDVDEVLDGLARGIAEPTLVRLPDWARAYAEQHGTLVAWYRCDRLINRKASTLVEKLKPAIGRIYRRMLWAGAEIRINDQLIAPVDPLFTRDSSPYGPPLQYRISLPPGDVETLVDVRFVELPVADWHGLPASEKRTMGVVGGAGVSILRAGREIDFGWHFMGSKRRENYDDWWRCEVSFSPAADELFGVTHSKQGIAPSSELRSILTPDVEGIARELNSRVRAAFELCRDLHPGAAAQMATARDQFLAPLLIPNRQQVRGDHFVYQILRAPLRIGSLFSATRRGVVIKVRLNSEHPFIDRLYTPAAEASNVQCRLAIESLVLAAARARLSCVTAAERDAVDRYIGEWSDALAAFMTR
jgi:hypothetical protein